MPAKQPKLQLVNTTRFTIMITGCDLVSQSLDNTSYSLAC